MQTDEIGLVIDILTMTRRSQSANVSMTTIEDSQATVSIACRTCCSTSVPAAAAAS